VVSCSAAPVVTGVSMTTKVAIRSRWIFRVIHVNQVPEPRVFMLDKGTKAPVPDQISASGSIPVVDEIERLSQLNGPAR
jgi:hypothetical protein